MLYFSREQCKHKIVLEPEFIEKKKTAQGG